MKDFIVYNSSVSEDELKQLNIFLSDNAVVQEGVVIYFNSCIIGDSIIYTNSVIHSNCTIINSTIRKETNVYSSRIENSEIGEKCSIGPFANIIDCTILDECKIGNFSVIKNTLMSNNVQIGHLSSIENAEIGKNSQVSTGVIFSSSEEERDILIGDNVKIGSNSSLISPVTISDGGYVAIGSVINKDVDVNEYAISRAKQTNSPLTDKKIK
ncbi:MAG: hypothetical protein IJX26_01145 [Clostridia bacterium]|nr:hypothetical protein [Clostridia bacterium]